MEVGIRIQIIQSLMTNPISINGICHEDTSLMVDSVKKVVAVEYIHSSHIYFF